MTVLIWLTHGREEKKKENPHPTPLPVSNRLSRRKSHLGQETRAGDRAPCQGPAQPAKLKRWKSCSSVLRVPPSSSLLPCSPLPPLPACAPPPQVLTDVAGLSPHPRAPFPSTHTPALYLFFLPLSYGEGTRRVAGCLPPQGAKLEKLGVWLALLLLSRSF